MAKKPEVIRAATTGRTLRNRIPRNHPRKKSSSIRGTTVAAAKTAPSAFHGTAFFKRKILVPINAIVATIEEPRPAKCRRRRHAERAGFYPLADRGKNGGEASAEAAK